MASTVHAAQAAWATTRSPGFNSLPLVRWLGSLGQAPGAPALPNLAVRLSQWLDWTDAIALSTALSAAAPPSAARTTSTAAAGAPQPRSAHGACQQVRHELTRSIGQDAEMQGTAAAEGTPAPADFAPYRAHCRAQQRKMEARIGRLRATVRSVLSARSTALAQLAALDAVMEQALAAREQHLLSTVPALLEQQFNHLPADQRAGFHRQVRSVLLAELDLRLQPVEGLLDALGPSPTPDP